MPSRYSVPRAICNLCRQFDLRAQLRHRQSGYGLHIGKLFDGCVVYADDIALLSVSCYGLQRLVDICANYGTLWDIKFNTAKSQVLCFYFGLSTTTLCGIYLNGSVIVAVDKVKYLFQRSRKCGINW